MEVHEFPWSFAGDMYEEDITFMLEWTDSCYKEEGVGRLVLTGEAPIMEIDSTDLSILLNRELETTKKCGKPPLFIATRDKTIKMLRFDPQVLLPRFPKDFIEEITENSLKRFLLPGKVEIEECDFYRSIIRHIAKRYPNCVASSDPCFGWYPKYMSTMLLLDKPGLLNVPVSTFFSLDKVDRMLEKLVFKPLSDEMVERLDVLRYWYKESPYIYPEEADFIFCDEPNELGVDIRNWLGGGVK